MTTARIALFTASGFVAAMLVVLWLLAGWRGAGAGVLVAAGTLLASAASVALDDLQGDRGE